MSTTHKKRKKRWSREVDRLGSGSEVISKSDSVPANEHGIIQKNRQVISKSGYEKDTKARNVISGYLSIIVQFLRDAKMELKKVKWPTRKELLASTAMVILLAIAIAFFLGLIDLGLTKVITKIIG
jgi:preprotein translocase subunit SecE